MKRSSTYRAAAAVALIADRPRCMIFRPRQKGLVMLNVRVTDVAPTADDAITTAVGADLSYMMDPWVISAGVGYKF